MQLFWIQIKKRKRKKLKEPEYEYYETGSGYTYHTTEVVGEVWTSDGEHVGDVYGEVEHEGGGHVDRKLVKSGEKEITRVYMCKACGYEEIKKEIKEFG